jgi:hypothetical protein
MRTDFGGSTATEEAFPGIHRTDASLIGERTFRLSRFGLRNKVGLVSTNYRLERRSSLDNEYGKWDKGRDWDMIRAHM